MASDRTTASPPSFVNWIVLLSLLSLLISVNVTVSVSAKKW